jgi:TonB family protein
LQISPNDAEISAELDAAIEQSLSLAESAMLESRVADAAAALQRIALVRPGNSRLPFLNAQLAQIQLREYLDDARLGIRESRFEDARFAIDGARSLVVTDASEIDAVDDELSAALSSQRVDDVLDKANARLEEGSLITPSNDNARYYYELALSNDPGNTAARQGLAVVASKLVLQARTQIDAQNFDEADALLADARRLDPSSSELITSTAALQAARDQLAQQRAAAEKRAADKRAAEQAAAEQRVADERAAEQAAAEQRVADKRAAEQAAAEQRVADELAAEEREIAEQQAAAANAEPIREAIATEAGAEPESATLAVATTEAADVEVSAADESSLVDVDTSAAIASQQPPPAVDEMAPVAVSSLQRIKYVAPKYPRAAQRRNISGWVDIIFTVDIDGSVTNISVRDSDPGDTFDESATNAVEAWKFEPVIENGVAIQKRAAVRMMFALE